MGYYGSSEPGRSRNEPPVLKQARSAAQPGRTAGKRAGAGRVLGGSAGGPAQGLPAIPAPAGRAGCLWTARRPVWLPLLSTLQATQFVTMGELVSRVGLALEPAPGRFAGLRWPGPGRSFSLGLGPDRNLVPDSGEGMGGAVGLLSLCNESIFLLQHHRRNLSG